MPLEANVEDVARRLVFARRDPKSGLRKNILLIGAGASVSAGIPTVRGLTQDLVLFVAKRYEDTLGQRSLPKDKSGQIDFSRVSEQDLRQHLVNEGLLTTEFASSEDTVNYPALYDYIFDKHMTNPDDSREFFNGIIANAKGAINWSHLAIGALVKRGYFSTVISTNFDQLALRGMIASDVMPIICDGPDTLNRISPAPVAPQLIEIHGSRHSYMLRNTPASVGQLANDQNVIGVLSRLFQNVHSLLVVGYGGREDGFMNALISVADHFSTKDIFWTEHSDNWENLSANARRLLDASDQGRVLLGCDSDRFFLDLMQALRCEMPDIFGNPLIFAQSFLNDIKASRIEVDDIRKTIDSFENRIGFLENENSSLTKSVVDEVRQERLQGLDKQSFETAFAALGDVDLNSRQNPDETAE